MNVLRSIRLESDRPDGRTAVFFGIALVSLWGARFAQDLVPSGWTRLAELNWWAGTQILFYGVLPMAVLSARGVRPAELGWRFRGIRRHVGVYLALLAVALPFVVLVSGSAAFLEHYPILEIEPGQRGVWRDMAIWWPFYAAQFAAIEMFFRGFLVIGLASRLGSVAVLVSVVPYMMIHFSKPPAEAAASIVGGLVLGWLALRTRSIVWGVALHIAVAAAMDISSLAHKGFVL